MRLMLSMVRNLWSYSPRSRRYLLQGLFLAAVFVVVAGSITNIYFNVVRQGMAYGWDFLWRATSWQLSVSIFPQSLTDPYWWTILMGIVNTLVLGLLCIVFATAIGSVIGLLRLSSNLVVRTATTAYVDILRNVPVILQIYFWYEVCRHAPIERRAISIADTFFISNRGFYFPSLHNEPGQGVYFLGVALIVVALIWLALRMRRLELLLIGMLTASAFFVWVGMPVTVERPVLRGFSFSGGHRIAIEFVALFLAITLYSSAYIAEIVRGGLLAVDKGQIEAARALGLRPISVNWYVRLPLAMRSALPPLSNQYLITMKVTSLGAAIGYADFFSVVSTSITHAGQTIELLVILMAGYLVINYAIAQIMQFINRKLALKTNKPEEISWPRRIVRQWRRQSKPA
jgi:general L-amino acid transport system permease protein